MSKCTLTIFIPTFNRPIICFRTIENTLACSNTALKILVISNSPNDGLIGLTSDIKDERLEVHYNEENIGFTGSFLKALKMADSDYMMIVSDEDTVDHPSLAHFIDQLQKFGPSTAISYFLPSIKFGNSNSLYIQHQERYYSNPSKTLVEIFDANTYISGTTFHLEKCKGVNFHAIAHPDNVYPHIYLRLALSFLGHHAYTSCVPLVVRGEEAKIGGDAYSDIRAAETKLNSKIYGYKARIKQEILFDETLFYNRGKISYYALQIILFKSKINFVQSLIFSHAHYKDVKKSQILNVLKGEYLPLLKQYDLVAPIITRLVLLALLFPKLNRIYLLIYRLTVKLFI